MRDHDAADCLVSIINLAPRLQAAYASGDWQTVLELSVYGREYYAALKSHAAQKLQPVPAVERPIPVAYFPGQF